MELKSTETEKRLARIAGRLYWAALERWRDKDETRQHAVDTNAKLPLGAYYLEVAKFALTHEMTAATAIKFRDTLAYPEALEIIFEDASSVLMSSVDKLEGEDLRLFLTVAAAVRWLQATAYETGTAAEAAT